MSFLLSNVTFSPSFTVTAYLLLVLTCLTTYLVLYRHLQSSLHPTLPSFFPSNQPKNLFLTLRNSTTPIFPPEVVKAALLLRAKEQISQIRLLQRSKDSAKKLLAQGYITQHTMDMMRLAGKEIRREISEIKGEARELGGDEWASVIMEQANECWQRELMEGQFDKWTVRVSPEMPVAETIEEAFE